MKGEMCLGVSSFGGASEHSLEIGEGDRFAVWAYMYREDG